ncbi:GNAT family N-acetyltransferase [Lactococcus garvieae]|jgi:ribosomal protein S18 acetylase RimI-like enzyme|uniref:GNAT family N-acetyltransferase n=1 Tax=Lactococcus garvieae TaxID=1363 RepID=UPI0009BE8EB4|nr:GNAT family N-acetyltransferase [Lactococcus garvieae]QPS71618.1 GNAT family N-acetyltransferase [Lactococcus garvieae]
MRIKNIELAHAEAFGQLQKEIYQENNFMLIEPDEQKTKLHELANQIASADFMIGADNDKGELVAYLAAYRGAYRRVQHRVSLVIAVRKSYRRQGIASQLFAELEEWARKNQITRLELTVAMNNSAAISCYKTNGFIIEGVRSQSLKINDELVDEFYMAKILE